MKTHARLNVVTDRLPPQNEGVFSYFQILKPLTWDKKAPNQISDPPKEAEIDWGRFYFQPTSASWHEPVREGLEASGSLTNLFFIIAAEGYTVTPELYGYGTLQRRPEYDKTELKTKERLSLNISRNTDGYALRTRALIFDEWRVISYTPIWKDLTSETRPTTEVCQPKQDISHLFYVENGVLKAKPGETLVGECEVYYTLRNLKAYKIDRVKEEIVTFIPFGMSTDERIKLIEEANQKIEDRKRERSILVFTATPAASSLKTIKTFEQISFSELSSLRYTFSEKKTDGGKKKKPPPKKKKDKNESSNGGDASKEFTPEQIEAIRQIFQEFNESELPANVYNALIDLFNQEPKLFCDLLSLCDINKILNFDDYKKGTSSSDEPNLVNDDGSISKDDALERFQKRVLNDNASVPLELAMMLFDLMDAHNKLVDYLNSDAFCQRIRDCGASTQPPPEPPPPPEAQNRTDLYFSFEDKDTGEFAAYVDVFLKNVDTDEDFWYAGTTDSSGSLIVKNVEYGYYQLLTRGDGWLDNDKDDLANDTFYVGPPPDYDEDLQPGEYVIQVLDADLENKPIVGAQVSIIRDLSQPNNWENVGSTDENGFIKISGLAPSTTYPIRIEHPDYISSEQDNDDANDYIRT